MTDPDLAATALGPVVAALEAQGIAHYVAGSLASSVHGMPRSTLDVDLVADLRPEHVERFAAALAAESTSTKAASNTPLPTESRST